MRLFISLLSIFVILAISCNKDKFLTKPTIRIISLNTEYVSLNEDLVITLECTDKEGDVQDSIFIVKRRLNQRVVPTLRDTLRFLFPVFPATPKTEIVATLDYQNALISAQDPPFIPGSNPAQRELDTLILKIAVRDKAGNISDTVTTNQIIVYRQ